MRTGPVVLRPATVDDLPFLARMLYVAWRWNESVDESAYRDLLHGAAQNPYLSGFLERPGDCGVIAHRRGEPVGAAWCRRMTAEAGTSGFVADDVPEIAVGVVESERGNGIGRLSMHRLIEMAAELGAPALSLHVAADNERAANLYRGCGFVHHHGDGRGGVLVRALVPARDRTTPHEQGCP